MARPRIYVNIKPALYQRLFDKAADKILQDCGEIVFETADAPNASADLAKKIKGFEVIVTGWGTPTFTDDVIQNADKLKLIAHSAGTIKHLLPEKLFATDIQVTHAAAAIAPAVADTSLLLTMTMLRQTYTLNEKMRVGEWPKQPVGYEIRGQKIGVIAASYTGRFFIKMLKALEADVYVFDPYLSEEKAAELGVKKTTLEHLLGSCRVVSMQAPTTPETKKMIGKRELALMRDGSILINTARSLQVDQDALLAELQSGRLAAALDVFDIEPLPADHPYRKLGNVHLTSHIAGGSVQSAQRQGTFMAEEVQRFFAAEPLKYRVRGEMLATMA